MTGSDTPRPDATGPEKEYSLSIDETAGWYARAGHPRTTRSIQRYCARGHLDCRKTETPFGDEYRVAPYSIDRHVAQIEELSQMTSRDATRQVAAHVVQGNSADTPQTDSSTDRDVARQDATDVAGPIQAHLNEDKQADMPDPSRPVATESRYVERLEKENDFLHDQISVKDRQIGELTERARETNHLIGGLQRMLTPLLGSGHDHERQPPTGDNRGEEHSGRL